jgi:hypothetical protein
MDTMTVAFHRIADKLGMDPIDVSTKNIQGRLLRQIPPFLRVTGYVLRLGKKAMNWKWHPAGAKKLPDGGCMVKVSDIRCVRGMHFTLCMYNYYQE